MKIPVDDIKWIVVDDIKKSSKVADGIRWILVDGYFEGTPEQFLDCFGLEFSGDVTNKAVQDFADRMGVTYKIEYDEAVAQERMREILKEKS